MGSLPAGVWGDGDGVVRLRGGRARGPDRFNLGARHPAAAPLQQHLGDAHDGGPLVIDQPAGLAPAGHQRLAVIAAEALHRAARARWRACSGVASSFLGWAEASGLIPVHPLPRKGAAKLAPAPAPRARVLSDAELRLVWQATARLSAKPQAFVRLLAMTGCRRSEAAGLAAGELDLMAGIWSLPGKRAKKRCSAGRCQCIRCS